jgi:hypothetical protein
MNVGQLGLYVLRQRIVRVVVRDRAQDLDDLSQARQVSPAFFQINRVHDLVSFR